MVKEPSLLNRVFGRKKLAESIEILEKEVPIQREVKVIKSVVTQNAPIGVTGTKSYGGYPNEEYFNKLRGRRRADIYDQMRRSDPQLVMALSSVKNLIKGASWSIEPGDDSDQAKKDAEFIEVALLKRIKPGWNQIVAEACSVIEFGHSVFEITHKIDSIPGIGKSIVIGNLGWRSPKTIERWNIEKDSGELESIDQYSYGDLQRLVRIPDDFLLTVSINKEGSNYEGVSMLRPCYGSWFRKDNYLKINGIGIERFAVPTPVAKIDQGKQGDESFAQLQDVLSAYTNHEESFLIVTKDVELDFSNNNYDPSKVEGSVDAEDRRMAKAFLANFLELGMGSSGGAYALSNDLSDFFLQGIEHIALLIAEPFNCKLIPDLIKLNFGERDVYPKLKHTGISDKAGKELAEILQILVNGKIIIPDDPLEVEIRRRYGLPMASEEGQRIAQAPTFGAATMAEKIRSISKARLKK